MNTLIIAEKPSVALRIAIALGNNTQKRLNMNGVSYYEIDDGKERLYIAAAVGHLFTIRQSDNKQGYPILDVKWSASYEVNKSSYFTKKYLDVFSELGKRSDHYINACDFDIEGTVIGTNIIKFLGGDMLKNSKRMKFSTTTIPDLKEAYANLMPLDTSNFYAGEARHMLDWLWGINLSRALTSALVGTKFMRYLSIGRVQGPTLAILARRELEIGKFISKPYWLVLALIKDVEFSNSRGEIFEKNTADKALEDTSAHSKRAVVKEVETNEQLVRPYPPFDLTALQLEASRVLRMDPSATLATAQSLYERAYISYPRTSSQKLPPTLGLPKIIGELAKNPTYQELANRLISERRFRPNEGIKSDEAHPAIYPTGIIPKSLTDVESRLYNLIVKRFMACFAAYAKVARMKVTIAAGGEQYIANGSRTLEKGWFEYYEYAVAKEKILPEFKKDEIIEISKAYTNELQTQPPRRYGKAALIAELEKKELGTKATRASIIDTLFKRGYIEGSSIKVTNFGMSVYNALNDNVNMIVNEETTRKLDEDMEKISEGKKTPEEVIKEGKDMLLEALKVFDSNKSKIAVEMQKGISDSEVALGKCPKDGGDLVIRKSKIGKQFVACANYPNCTVTYSIPQNALIVPTGKICEHCKTPIVKVIRKGKGVFEIDLDPDCITKKKWKEKMEKKKSDEAAKLNAVTAKELMEKTKAKESKPLPKPPLKKQAKGIKLKATKTDSETAKRPGKTVKKKATVKKPKTSASKKKQNPTKIESGTVEKTKKKE
jgi:DNA topoisomerase-1